MRLPIEWSSKATLTKLYWEWFFLVCGPWTMVRLLGDHPLIYANWKFPLRVAWKQRLLYVTKLYVLTARQSTANCRRENLRLQTGTCDVEKALWIPQTNFLMRRKVLRASLLILCHVFAHGSLSVCGPFSQLRRNVLFAYTRDWETSHSLSVWKYRA